MVENGHNSIQTIDFESSLHPRVPVEVLDRRELMERVEGARLRMAQRPRFHVLILTESDVGWHTVDFTRIAARECRMIHVRPGQVQAWNTEDDFDATIVLARPTAGGAGTWFSGHASHCDLDTPSWAVARSLVEALTYQQDGFTGDLPARDFMVSMFNGLVALFDQAAGTRTYSDFPEAYVAFREAIEADLTHHDVVDYARDLGYSTRTLARACQRVTGRSAKGVLTDRQVLEAMRLLAHTDLTVAAISSRLGFTEPTNFTKFFVANSGETPSSFRKTHRSPSTG